MGRHVRSMHSAAHRAMATSSVQRASAKGLEAKGLGSRGGVDIRGQSEQPEKQARH